MRADSFRYELYLNAPCLQLAPKGPPMGVTTDEEDILVELVTQTIDPKLFADRPAMGNVVTARDISRRNVGLPFGGRAGPEEREIFFY